MARARSTGNGRLAEALETLIQNQAALVANQTAFVTHARETDARFAEMERRIEERFRRIEAILLEHSRILQGLPDAIRDKIGFKPPAP
jgi:hypothetical protein